LRFEIRVFELAMMASVLGWVGFITRLVMFILYHPGIAVALL
jgi:hypothetical protein